MTTTAQRTTSERIALWTLDWLGVLDGRAVRPPTALLAWSHREATGRRLTAISRGDAFDLYYGRHSPVVLSIAPATALKLAWFLLWRWWIVGTFCGLKMQVWNSALAILMRGGK